MASTSRKNPQLDFFYLAPTSVAQWGTANLQRRQYMDTIDFSFERECFDLAAIHRYLHGSYWAAGIPISVVQKAIENSLCIGGFVGQSQVAFARMVTDRASFAYLADVYVLPEYTGQGIAKQMLQRLFAHPDLQGLRRIMLATRDAHSLYAKFGFTPLPVPERFMERHNPHAYTSAAK